MRAVSSSFLFFLVVRCCSIPLNIYKLAQLTFIWHSLGSKLPASSRDTTFRSAVLPLPSKAYLELYAQSTS